MRNDLQRLILIPGRRPKIVLEPEDEGEIAILARIIHEAEHESSEDEDVPMEDEDDVFEEWNQIYNATRGV